MVRLTDTRIVVYFTHGTVLETAVGENIFLVVFQPAKHFFLFLKKFIKDNLSKQQ